MKEKMPKKATGSDVQETRTYCKKLLETIQEQTAIKDMPAVKEKINQLEEVLIDCQEEEMQSNDPDARTGHKSQDLAFFGYKTYIALTKERIITAATVTTGEKSDGKYLKELVEQSKKAGMEVDTVLGDTSYSGTDNLQFAQDEGQFQLISRLHPGIINGQREENDGFVFNKDADTFACPAVHLATKRE